MQSSRCPPVRRVAFRSASSIAGYGGPVLLVHGTKDETVPVRYSIDASEAYENAQLVLLEGDDHGYHRHLDQVCAMIQRFLRALA